MSSSEFDVAAGAEQAWADFRARLADRIAEMTDDDIVTVEVESGVEEDELLGAVPYVQLVGWGEELVRAEVVSNQYLDERYELSPADEQRLASIGWFAPTNDEGDEPDTGSTNFHLDVGRREADRLAVMTVRALREVFGCLHPAFLITDGLPAAAVEAPQVAAEPMLHEPEATEVVLPESPEELQLLVDQALAPMLGGSVKHDDGDVPIVCGQSVVFVRICESRPAVDLYCELVVDVVDLERAVLEVGILNRSHPSARFHLRDDRVIATYRLYAWPFAPTQLLVALSQFSEDIDDLARDLATRVGGHRFGEAAEALAEEADASGVDDASNAEADEEDSALTGLLEILYDGPARPGQVAALFDNDRRSLVRQLVRLRTGQDQPGEHDLEMVLGQLRAGLRFLAGFEALPPRPRPLPPRPDRTRQLSLLPDGEDTLDAGLWVHDLEETS